MCADETKLRHNMFKYTVKTVPTYNLNLRLLNNKFSNSHMGRLFETSTQKLFHSVKQRVYGHSTFNSAWLLFITVIHSLSTNNELVAFILSAKIYWPYIKSTLLSFRILCLLQGSCYRQQITAYYLFISVMGYKIKNYDHEKS